jgi:hypothetical protein
MSAKMLNIAPAHLVGRSLGGRLLAADCRQNHPDLDICSIFTSTMLAGCV